MFLLSIQFGTVYENFYTNAAHLLTCGVSELNTYDSTRSYPQVKREDLNKYFKGGGGGLGGGYEGGEGRRATHTHITCFRYKSLLTSI